MNRKNFYPRSPRGERPTADIEERKRLGRFLSTLPAWGATAETDKTSIGDIQFLSTLPAWGATHPSLCDTARHTYFYPRSPRGERPGSH